MACRSSLVLVFLTPYSLFTSTSLFLSQVAEASSSDDDSSSDSEGAVATPAAGKKEVSFRVFSPHFPWKHEKTRISLCASLDFYLSRINAPSFSALWREDLCQSPLREG